MAKATISYRSISAPRYFHRVASASPASAAGTLSRYGPVIASRGVGSRSTMLGGSSRPAHQVAVARITTALGQRVASGESRGDPDRGSAGGRLFFSPRLIDPISFAMGREMPRSITQRAEPDRTRATTGNE